MIRSDYLAPFLRSLEENMRLGADDREAILSLSAEHKLIAPEKLVFKPAGREQQICIVLEGAVCGSKSLPNGSCQILGLFFPGDIANVDGLFSEGADCELRALTRAKVALVSIEDLLELAFSRPAIGRTLWFSAHSSGLIAKEWMTNLGRRDARSRLAHFLCELAVRMSGAGMGTTTCFRLPLSRQQIADVLSLHPVCISRTMQTLREERLIDKVRGRIVIEDWGGLARAAGFRPHYLRRRTGPAVKRTNAAAAAAAGSDQPGRVTALQSA